MLCSPIPPPCFQQIPYSFDDTNMNGPLLLPQEYLQHVVISKITRFLLIAVPKEVMRAWVELELGDLQPGGMHGFMRFMFSAH